MSLKFNNQLVQLRADVDETQQLVNQCNDEVVNIREELAQ